RAAVGGRGGGRGRGPRAWRTMRWAPMVGTAGPGRAFDRRFRPPPAGVGSRWGRRALAQRRGEAIPPIEVYRVGQLHFVTDGHHRVSIATATRQCMIDAYVTQVLTAAPPERISPVSR